MSDYEEDPLPTGCLIAMFLGAVIILAIFLFAWWVYEYGVVVD